MIGCGNSTLSRDLYDVGYNNLVSIDISNKVVDQMNQMHGKDRPDLKFVVQDVTNMADFAEDNRFSVALDKGTLDAMFTDDSQPVIQSVDKMFSEMFSRYSV